MNRLSVRLFVSHLAVAVIGAVTAYAVVRLLAPTLFDSRMRMMGPRGLGQSGELRSTFVSAVNTSLLVGLALSAAVAATAAGFAAHRLLGPLRAVRSAARRLAAGHYDEQVAAPREVELAELVHDVNDLAGRLADTEERRVRLISDVAHELRTPLTVIDGYVEGMVDGVFPLSTETLQPVVTELHRLRRLTDDLSALSRTEENRLELRSQVLDLPVLVEQSAERLRPQFDESGVSLTVTGASAPVRVSGDPDRLAQVVTNLLGNALRAAGPGGAVEVRTGHEHGTAHVRVIDDGEGLARDDLERVFERFYRVRNRRSGDPSGGSGIGLTIARAIARAHGGDITAASAGLGAGAAFTVTLPALPDRGA
ncbi:histidine kinase [Kribbella orskensis]|uniref:Sensor-like histidine kinase SenX3 n=1 Tax=Kribbella orskensis TaxID=2512216 RepID=A0ABY2B6D5_9ACTN|nr:MULTISPECIES: ATP-binding protein [Kribbella]TCN28323.1 histidine kinase [Kribbella sp. VKM Ac-2500]TCO08186.1 histidine kinase [Kribbella orskensis]